MKRLFLSILLILVLLPALAQENGRTMKPNYRKIARVIKSPESPYYIDSLIARFDRCDTTLTVDHFRCLYYGQVAVGDTLYTLRGTYRRYQLMASRFGLHSRRAGDAWWQYQMLLTAVWSTGDGSRRKPLHVLSRAEADFMVEIEEGMSLDGVGMGGRRRCAYSDIVYLGDRAIWFRISA